MFAREIPLLAAQPGDGNSALPFAAFRRLITASFARFSQFSLSRPSCAISNRSIPSALRLSRGTFSIRNFSFCCDNEPTSA
jgi:hypothetical protein